MNAFAKTLMPLLLGWLRRLFQDLLSAFSKGTVNGFLLWLGEHWLHIVVLLVLLGAVGDFAVWFVRWKPYLVWRTWRRKADRRLTGKEERRFTQGYQDGVQGIQNQQNAVNVPQTQDFYDEQPMQAEAQQPVWTQQMPTPMPAPETAQKNTLHLEELYEAQKSPAQEQQKERKRRSDRHKTGLRGAISAVRQRLNQPEEEETMLDGLPPVVNQEDAFYAPVLPQNENHTGDYS